MHSEWTQYDYALASAVSIIEDLTDQNGVFIWDRDSDRVEITADKKIDPFKAAMDRKTGAKNYKPSAGEYFVPGVTLVHGDRLPTYGEWREAQIQKALEQAEEGAGDQ